ncbi:cbb3-type cytochrome c oxidase subunit I [Neptunicella sp. SCSIO 80796]|uniref:cbb3-type cytochrome c oxidase subunit I n=1 Tax=Neptunicella plasticusilytica TaxID=3117012 RepID=UPI003A4E24CA
MNLWGKLQWQDITLFSVFRHPTTNVAIDSGAGWLVVLGTIAVLCFFTRNRLWRTVWFDWLTSLDHKKIGLMYIILALVMLIRGVAEGFVMRLHQASDTTTSPLLSSHHFAELFSTHGTIMIFFVGMPFIIGFINYLVPLQIGARDMAFPLLNQVSLGLTAGGATLIMISLMVGEFETGGWTAYPSYTSKIFSPGVGPDYWIWSIGLSGIGTMLSGVNFAVTIYKLRAPGMDFFRLPLFTWTALCTSILIIFAMPPLTVATVMLALDRYLDFHFFTNDLGGNMMNYANLFWMFGHPEVYILILPAYGVFSEVAATFAGKRLYGYRSLVIATMGITVLSFTVWVHHFFTMGQRASLSAAFGIATLLIAIPTGVKVYDWLATLYRGRIRITTPVVYLAGFFILFVIGGLSGLVLANPSIDFQVHNSLFLVAHFHNVLLPGLLFGMLAGVHFWFPKAFGFRLSERYGKLTAYLWIIGFSITFLPLYWAGLKGMPRRSALVAEADLSPLMLLTAAGAIILLLALFMLLFTFWYSYKHQKAFASPNGDPWNGRTLEWWTPSPPHEWNFAHPLDIKSRDAFVYAKKHLSPYDNVNQYHDIVMPGRSSLGVIFMLLTIILGFSLTWEILWLAVLSASAVPVMMIASSFRADPKQIIPAAEIKRRDQQWRKTARDALSIRRDQETTSQNTGKAAAEGETE